MADPRLFSVERINFHGMNTWVVSTLHIRKTALMTFIIPLDPQQNVFKKKKKKLHYTRGITPNRVKSDGANFRGLAPGQHSSEETSQRWRAVDDTVFNLTDLGIEPHTSRIDGNVSTAEL